MSQNSDERKVGKKMATSVDVIDTPIQVVVSQLTDMTLKTAWYISSIHVKIDNCS